MTLDRFERYKDALRRGHVAALRDRFGEAMDAYEEAAELAPERALPHTSVGRILVKLKRPSDALTAFGRALDRAPNDEAALAGRSEVLVALVRRVEAAEAFARLAEAQAAAGKLAAATDAARQALELAESRQGRSFLQRLVDQLGDAGDDAAVAAAMERAMRILEPPEAPEPEPATEPEAQGEAVQSASETAQADESAARAKPAEPPTTPPERIVDEAESLAAAGRSAEARERYLVAASAYRSDRRLDAAVDACLTVLRFDPADPAVHLLLADLYLDHGWRSEASTKLDLLQRLSSLTGDTETERLAAATAAARLPVASGSGGATEGAPLASG
jgi:tetratricopeptide (TPR) repeat protein